MRAPLRVIAVLLPAPGIAARGLQVAGRVRADPNIPVRWRNRQPANARKLAVVGDLSPIWTYIGEMGAAPDAPDSRRPVIREGESYGRDS